MNQSLSNPPKPRRRWRRWSIRIAVGAGILLLGAMLIVQIVLWTDFPRRFALREAQKQLGLRITASSLSIGWLGHTSLTDLTVGLPLSDEPFLRVPRIDVSHTSLFGIIASLSVDVSAITVESPALSVVQDADGNWNLQQAANLATGGPSNAPPSSPTTTSAIVLPKVTVNNASIDLTDSTGRQASIHGLSVHAGPQGALIYDYQATVPGQLALLGRIVPKSPWQHELSLHIHDIGPWVNDWVADWPDPASLALDWSGQLTADGIGGVLTIERMRINQQSASGIVDVTTQKDQLTLAPRRLSMDIPQGGIRQVDFLGGQIRAQGSVVTLDRLLWSIAGGQIELNGRLAAQDPSAQLSATWFGVGLPRDAIQNGTMELNVSVPWPDRPQVDLRLMSSGQLGGRDFDTKLSLAGKGQSWSNIDWLLKLDTLRYDQGEAINLHDVAANVRQRGKELFLDQITVPSPARLDARGYINLADAFASAPTDSTRPTTNLATVASSASLTDSPATDSAHRSASRATWYLWFDGNNWRVPGTADTNMRLILNSWGDPGHIVLEQAFASLGDLRLSANATYIFARPAPLDANFYLLNASASAMGTPLARLHPDTPAADDPPQASGPNQSLRGTLSGEARISGKVFPMALDITGQLHGKKLVVMDRPLGDVDVAITGSLTPMQGIIRTERFGLLGGDWGFWAAYPTEPKSMRIGLEVWDLNLKEIGALAKLDDLDGSLNGHWQFDLPQAGRPRMTGQFKADKLRLGPLKADTLTGDTRLDANDLSLNAQLSQNSGRADVAVTTRLDDLDRLSVSINATDWALDADGASLLLSASAEKLAVDLKQLGATGTVNATINATHNNRSIGQLTMQSRLSGRQILVGPLGGNLLGGSISGQWTADLDQLLQMQGTLAWADVQTEQLGDVWPALKPLSGKFSGKISAGASPSSRAPGPLRVEVTVDAEQGRYNGMKIGDFHAVAYAATMTVGGSLPERFILDQSQLHIADGTIDLWGRLSRHADGVLASQVIVNLERLSLDQLVHALGPDAQPMPGQLDGSLTGVGSPDDLSRVYVQGTFKLTDSDLANFGPISALYDAMHLDLGTPRPTGEGQINLRIENGRLIIPHASYFNRGVEAVATAQIDDIYKGPDSPVQATIVGSARPLKDVKLPFAADVDSIFQAIQTSVTTVGVSGTLGQLKWGIVPFQQVGEGLREILFGEVRDKK